MKTSTVVKLLLIANVKGAAQELGEPCDAFAFTSYEDFVAFIDVMEEVENPQDYTEEQKVDWVKKNQYDPEKDTCPTGTKCAFLDPETVNADLEGDITAWNWNLQYCQTCDFLEDKAAAVVVFDDTHEEMEDVNGVLIGDYAGLEDRFAEIEANNVVTFEGNDVGYSCLGGDFGAGTGDKAGAAAMKFAAGVAGMTLGLSLF